MRFLICISISSQGLEKSIKEILYKRTLRLLFLRCLKYRSTQRIRSTKYPLFRLTLSWLATLGTRSSVCWDCFSQRKICWEFVEYRLWLGTNNQNLSAGKTLKTEPVYDICRLQTADCRLQTADRRLQTADRIDKENSACTKTRNNKTKPPKRNERNRRNNRNGRNERNETKSPKQAKPLPLLRANRKQANLSDIQANQSAIQANRSVPCTQVSLNSTPVSLNIAQVSLKNAKVSLFTVSSQ